MCAKRGRDRLADYTVLYRELTRVDSIAALGRLRAVGEGLLPRALATQPGYTLDRDSTVAILYGEQEGAHPGPNPQTRGRPSYHPLLCRERTATDAVAFLRQSVTRLPHARRRRVLVRADRGFDAEALYAEGERRGWHDVVKLRVTADLARQIWLHATQGRWRPVDSDGGDLVEVAELRLQRQCWRRPRRVVLTRRRDPENPQGHLWDTAGYLYAAYVTDVDWAPEEAAAFYDKRADVEKAIHEIKADFGLDRIASNRFLANAADIELKVLASNLLVLFQRQALGWAVVRRAKTLRRRVRMLTSQLIRPPGSGSSSSPPTPAPRPTRARTAAPRHVLRPVTVPGARCLWLAAPRRPGCDRPAAPAAFSRTSAAGGTPPWSAASGGSPSAGSSSAPIVGTTGSARCWCGGNGSGRTTWASSTSPAASLRFNRRHEF